MVGIVRFLECNHQNLFVCDDANDDIPKVFFEERYVTAFAYLFSKPTVHEPLLESGWPKRFWCRINTR